MSWLADDAWWSQRLLKPEYATVLQQVMALTLGTHVDERGWDGVDIDTDDIIIHPVYLRVRLIFNF